MRDVLKSCVEQRACLRAVDALKVEDMGDVRRAVAG